MATEKQNLLKEAKRWIRGACRNARRSISAAERKRGSFSATQRLLRWPGYRRAKTIGVFLSFGSEIRTDGVIERAWKDGKRVVVPMYDRGFSRPYFVVLQPGDRIERIENAPPKLLGPITAVPFAAIDLVLVPGLAFDSRFHRLGYGGGVYDRLLANTPRAFHVGFFYADQFLPVLPVAPHDLKLDVIVTETGVLRPSRH